MGTILSTFGNNSNPSASIDLLHDPNAGTAAATTDPSAYKKLRAERKPDGNVMLSISAGGKQYSLPVAPNEMAVILELLRYAVPRALGFDLQHASFEEAS